MAAAVARADAAARDQEVTGGAGDAARGGQEEVRGVVQGVELEEALLPEAERKR